MDPAMKKYILPSLLLILVLAACGTPAAEVTPMPTPTPSAAASPSPEPTPTLEASLPPMADDGARYFFFGGGFMGSWSDGQWHSAAGETFTVGELFDRTYYDFWGEALGAARFYLRGPGGFEDERVIPLLEPYGIIEGDDFIMKLPGQFTGEAAAVTVSNYGFFVLFDGQVHVLVSNVPLERPDPKWTDPDLSAQELTQALEGVGIHYKDPTRADRTAWLCDMDGDGHEEYLELIQAPRDESCYTILQQGDPCFYAFLLRDGEQVSVIASRAFPYTDDVTAHFWASDPYFYDLDGDGVCELLFQDHCWEWGSYDAYSLIDGVWTLVLRGDYGT